ncbi:Toll-like receptor 4 [Mytilus edulis]|uniref:Toll-like receptor 4 n=1 Tax=Mytilus edulis TaxID=6550 RepID=A0A8S3SGU8_MYTED|nr:Toll-like receptor 4 [Mytilus edulis]
MKFVHEDCIQNLETDKNLKLCIHHRDFIPGEEITVNITNAIHRSRKTICIITKSFLESYYCMFEFNMAKTEGIYSRKGENTLILVFCEDILPRDLPLVLLELVQRRSYIPYHDDQRGNIEFWGRIKEAICGNELEKSKNLNTSESTELEEGFVYDTFVAYAEEDMKFVHEDCIQNLETDKNLKLCINHRDFIPGEEITVIITNVFTEIEKNSMYNHQIFS